MEKLLGKKELFHWFVYLHKDTIYTKIIMAEFVSEIKTIPHNQEKVYNVLSDLTELRTRIGGAIPGDKVSDLVFEPDSCSFSMNPVGQVKLRIVEREPYKTVKFEAEQLPIATTMWIQLVESAADETKVKITVRMDLPAMLKTMMGKQVNEAIDRLATALTILPY